MENKQLFTGGLLTLCLLLSVSWQAVAGTPPPIPQRIVSLGPINTENVFLLGAQDRLVANTSYCNRPEAAKKVDKIGSVMQVSVEKILSLRPDLVLATGLTQERQVKKLERLGLNVVRFTQPTSFTDICEQFLLLGRLLGVPDRAEEIVRTAGDRVERVREVTGGLPRAKIFLQIGSQPLFSSVQSSFTHDYIVLANGENIAGEQSNGSITVEKVIAKDPDLIVIAIMGSESGIAAQERDKWLRFSGLQAVVNHRVHLIDPNRLCSPSPATFVDTLEEMAVYLHPEIQEDLQKEEL